MTKALFMSIKASPEKSEICLNYIVKENNRKIFNTFQVYLVVNFLIA